MYKTELTFKQFQQEEKHTIFNSALTVSYGK